MPQMSFKLTSLGIIAVFILLLTVFYLTKPALKLAGIDERNTDTIEILGDSVTVERANRRGERGVPKFTLGSAIESIRSNNKTTLNVIIEDKLISGRINEILNLAGEVGFLEVVFVRKSTNEKVIYSIPSFPNDNEIYKYIDFVDQSNNSNYKEIYSNGKKSVCFSVTAKEGYFEFRGRKLSESQLKNIISEHIRNSHVVLVICYVNTHGTIMDWWAIGEFSKNSNVSFVLRKSQ